MWPIRHGLGGRLGGVFHGDAIGLGVLHVDVIHAYAAADDQLQLAALGLVDVVGADLGLGADHHHVEITQGLAQLIRLVELLHHLVTHLAQLRHRGLVHTVSNQNTHGNILLCYYNLLIFVGGRRGRPPASPCRRVFAPACTRQKYNGSAAPGGTGDRDQPVGGT